MDFDSLDEIWMNGEFNAKEALDLRKKILSHAEMGPQFPIVIYINSYGGAVDALNSILDTLDSIPNPIITVCSGTAMSCGAVLLAYGHERYIGKNSRVMIHQVSHGAWGSVKETDNTVKESKRVNKELVKILAERTGQDISTIQDIFNENVDKYFNAVQAKQFGIVDKIGIPKIYKELVYRMK